MKRLIAFLIIIFFSVNLIAQTDSVVISRFTAAASRKTFHDNVINNSIIKNLSLSLTDSTEENWEDAFASMELIRYRTSWTDEKTKNAFKDIGEHSISFQKAAIEMAYALYPDEFGKEIDRLARSTDNMKVLAMAAEYVIQKDKPQGLLTALQSDRLLLNTPMETDSVSKIKAITIAKMLVSSAKARLDKAIKPIGLIKAVTQKDYLPGNTIIYSFQRKNRNYPGLALVRAGKGNFIKDEKGKLFSVTQLARSKSGMPGYLTSGNTPQGLFRMYGFEVSKSAMIGPTTNIQLTMPFEASVQHFLKDSSITDTVWSESMYKKLLPKQYRDYQPLMQTYFASLIGRTEIIAHGTTVDPSYYKGQPYYPQTPTEGCLCTKESWDANGKRIASDQQKLVESVKQAGGPDGYIIVIEIDDQQKPVTINELLPFINRK